MRRSIVYVAVAIVVVVVLGALVLTRTAGDGSEPETAATVEALITGQVANFTLNREAKPTASVSFADADGGAASFADFRGKVVLVNVWATWCAPCVREMPTLDRLEADLGGADFAVVAVAVDRQGLPAVARFYDTHGIANLPPFVDPSYAVPRALGVIGLPTTVLLDRAGREIGRLVGGAEWDSPEAIALIRHVIEAGRPTASAPAPDDRRAAVAALSDSR